MANKIKSIIFLNGYESISKFCKHNNIEYQSFLRKINCKQKYTLKDIETLSELLNLTPEETIEFFLPKLFRKMKQKNK